MKPGTTPHREAALMALQALGWPKRTAMRALEDAVTRVPPTASVDEVIRAALAALGTR